MGGKEFFKQLKYFKNLRFDSAQWFSSTRNNVISYIKNSNLKAKPASWRRFTVYGFLTLGFLIMIAGGISAASASSLPGDILYTWRVNVSEKVQGALVLNPEKKLDYQFSLLKERLKEVENVNLNPSPSQKAHTTALAQLTAQVDKVEAQTDNLAHDNPDKALATQVAVVATLDTHKEALAALEPEENKSENVEKTISTLDNVVTKLDDQTETIASKSNNTQTIQEIKIKVRDETLNEIAPQLKEAFQKAQRVRENRQNRRFRMPMPGTIISPPPLISAPSASPASSSLELDSKTASGSPTL